MKVIPLSRYTSKRHKKGAAKGVSQSQDAQDKSASNETKKKKATRGFIPPGGPHSSLDRWRKSCGVGCRGGVPQVMGLKKGWKPRFGKEDDEDGIKRGSHEAQTKRLSLVKKKKTPCVGEV